MTYSSALTDESRPLVLDTSVLINLHACTFGERVLTAIPNAIIVTDVVATEIDSETGLRNGDHGFLRRLVAEGRVSTVAMSDEEFAVFGALTSGASSLDDGEAATIAVASCRGFGAVIDERKGRTQALSLMQGRGVSWTLDLLLHAAVTSTLGSTCQTDAIYLALHKGRMRIPHEISSAIVEQIGLDRAIKCPSLPNYKQLLNDREGSDGLR